MSVMMVRSTVRSECVPEVDAAATKMFQAIKEAGPTGIRYASYKLADGVTYVAVLQLDEGVENPLPGVDAFRQFQDGLKDWVADVPVAGPVSVIGSYG